MSLPTTMCAARLTGYGGLDKLEVRCDVPVPQPAARMNNSDINNRTSWYSQPVSSGTTADGGRAGFGVTSGGLGAWSGDEEIERISQITEALRPGDCCWFDVNRGWTVDRAMQVLPRVIHLAQGLPAEATIGLYDYHHREVPLVLNPLAVRGCQVGLPADCGAGLGVEVNEEILGEPLAVVDS